MKAAKRHKNIPQSQLLVCSGICVSGGGPESMVHLSGSNLVVGLKERSLVSHANRIRSLSWWASPIESYHDIRFCSSQCMLGSNVLV